MIWSNTFKSNSSIKTERKVLSFTVANMNSDDLLFFPFLEEKFNFINVRLKNG